MTTERRWLVFALAFTIAVRLVIAGAAALAGDPDGSFHAPDSGRYLQLASTLAEDHVYEFGGRPELFRPPGFPLLVAIGSSLGHPTAVTLILNSVLAALTAWICFLAGTIAGKARAGAWAAVLYALEPGQWAWSAMVLSETLFTTCIAACLLAGCAYVRHRRLPMLLLAVGAAVLAAYVRVVAYLLPFVVLIAAVWIAPAGARGAHSRLKHLAAGALVAIIGLGVWHVRNGLLTGYWGFSIQFDRAVYLMGEESAVPRLSGTAHLESYGAMRKQMEAKLEERPPQSVAREIRMRGFHAVAANPGEFFVTYAAGIGSVLLHPGTGAFMRLFGTGTWVDDASATQLLVLRKWEDARSVLTRKPYSYWILMLTLVPINIAYLVLFGGAAWRGRSSPFVVFAVAMAGYFLAVSGGPEADSRRRVPLTPLACVTAGPAVAALSARRRRAGTHARPQSGAF